MKSLESKRIGKITTQQAIKKNQVRKVYFIENPSEIYLFESFTWITIQIVYVLRAILRDHPNWWWFLTLILSLGCLCSHKLTLCWYHYSNLSWDGCHCYRWDLLIISSIVVKFYEQVATSINVSLFCWKEAAARSRELEERETSTAKARARDSVETGSYKKPIWRRSENCLNTSAVKFM